VSIESDFVDALDAYAPLVALVGDRISKNMLDQDAPRPLVVFNANHEPQHGLDNSLQATLCTFTVACWAGSGTSAAAVADAVEAALNAFTASQTSAIATVLGRAGAFDEEIFIHGEVLTVEWWAL
jgi:hypothetical protein